MASLPSGSKETREFTINDSVLGMLAHALLLFAKLARKTLAKISSPRSVCVKNERSVIFWEAVET